MHHLIFFLNISQVFYESKPYQFTERRKHVGWEGRIEATRAESQWIVAARPLCHLQCPVAYLSRLQRIQPTARWEGSFEAADHGTSAGPT